MLRRKFDIDANEGAFLTERELHDLELQKDNVPKFLNEMDVIMIQIGRTSTKVSESIREVLFARQTERSTQLEKGLQ